MEERRANFASAVHGNGHRPAIRVIPTFVTTGCADVDESKKASDALKNRAQWR